MSIIPHRIPTAVFTIAALALVAALPSAAGDEDIFSAQIAPNVVLMVDNSGSMNAIMEHPSFDAEGFTPTCDVLPDGGGDGYTWVTDDNGDWLLRYCWPEQCIFLTWSGLADWTATPDPFDHPLSGYVEREFCGQTRRLYNDGVNQSYGNYTWYYSGYTEFLFSLDAADAVTTWGPPGEERTAPELLADIDDDDNGLRYIDGSPFAKFQIARITAARDIARDVIYQTNSDCPAYLGDCGVYEDRVRFGIAQFHAASHGGFVNAPVDAYSNNKSDLENAITSLDAQTATPLSETLFKLYTYFMPRDAADLPNGADGTTAFPGYVYNTWNGDYTSTVATGDERPDLFVPGAHLNGALHGDRVVGRIEHRRRSGKVEGRVIRTLEESRRVLVGTYRTRGRFPFVRPIDPRLGREVLVAGEEQGARDGQLVTIEIVDRGRGRNAPAGEIREVLGSPDEARIDVEVVIREYGLRHEFPEEVIAEADAIPTEVQEADVEGRTDFRSMPIITIDGEKAQDFDDAVFVELRPNGLYRLHVHIADVSHYVKPGTAIDNEAVARGTSVYFVDRVLPMLPEQLANGICSLKPKVDRLVQSVLIDIDRDGRTVNYEFHDGVINSAARMTYREVAAILGGDDAARGEHAERVGDLERMGELAKILTRHRRERGSIDFDLPVPEIVLNLQGETEDVIRSERNAAHRLIEEFMIRANEVVASHLLWEDVPAMYRVHEGPDPERIENLREFLSGLGHTLGGGRRPQPRDFMELLERLDGRPEERVVSMLLLRSMKQARYQGNNDGHFGLASPRYTHFTSPIRRYPDLMVHRALRAERAATDSDKALEPLAGLDRIAASSSTLERSAEEAERNYSAWKKLQFMADKVGETYEGHIVGVKSFGFFVELDAFFVEGMVAVSSLDDDYYLFDEAKHRLYGDRSGRAFQLGDRVKVTVAKVDMIRRHLDFGVLEGPLEIEPPPPVKRRRRRRGRRGRGQAEPKTDAVATEETTEEPKAAAPAESGKDAATEDRPRRRRRGRRGGRKRSRGGAERSSQADKADKPEKAAESKSDGNAKKSAKPAEKADKRSEREARGGQRGRRRGGRGRGSDRGRGSRSGNGRQRSEGARPAPAAPVTSPSKPAAQPESDSGKPVNPYLTDLDF